MDKFEQHIKRMKGLRDVYEAGTGQHNILSMLITECEAALRQPIVIGSVCTCTKFRETPMINGKHICSICNKPIVQIDL
jgi:hypothetical protein